MDQYHERFYKKLMKQRNSVLILKNVSVEEIAAIKEFLDKRRREVG